MTFVKKDINVMLHAMLGRRDLVDTWWDSPNKAFDMKTPNEVYLSSEDGRRQVYQYVSAFVWGY